MRISYMYKLFNNIYLKDTTNIMCTSRVMCICCVTDFVMQKLLLENVMRINCVCKLQLFKNKKFANVFHKLHVQIVRISSAYHGT
jgi:hypothetical protein